MKLKLNTAELGRSPNDGGIAMRLHSRAHRGRALLLLPILALMMGGCGDDDSPTGPGPKPAPNKVLQLDGNGDYVEVPFGTHTFSQFTLECLVKVPSIDDNVHYISLHQGAYLVLGDYGSGNGPVSTWADGLDPLDAAEATAAPDMTTDAWHHLAFSYDGANQYVLIDGTVVLTVPTTGSVTNNAGFAEGLVIGARYTKSGQFVNGQMDEVRVWNVYRTPEQIRATMNKVLTSPSGLVGYWNFDDGTAKDGTAYHADGTLAGDAKIVNK